MGVWDYVILIAVAVGLVAAVVLSRRRSKRGGGCCGDCCRCHSDCRQPKKK